ncbi:MAG: hypothetical protein HC822_03230 [Oscillochloris sp.]|nr:hypothetical protein [Oscillochloris sp.]
MSILRDAKRLFAVVIAGSCGLIILLDFGGAGGVIAAIAGLLISWAAMITAIALLLGIFSVAWSHVQRVRLRSPDWGYSLVLLVGLIAVIMTGIFFPLSGPNGIVLPSSLAEGPIRAFFRIVYEPLAGSLLALLAFFSLSAALRAVRRRSLEAITILVIACLVLIAQLPIVAGLPGIGVGMQWLNDYVALAGARGLLIGSAIGALVASVRVLLGFDIPYLDR